MITTWDENKSLDHFTCLVNNLEAEGQISRAVAIAYLIDRCKKAEALLQQITDKSNKHENT